MMKRLLWVVLIAAICIALLAGRDDIRRIREMYDI
jgi:hypothetical protein